MPTIVIAALQLLGPTVESPFVHLRSGVDVVDLVSLGRLLKSDLGEPFLARVFSEDELTYCGDDLQRLGGRWAAKEAVAKAVGTGFREGLNPVDIEIGHDRSTGAPMLRQRSGAIWPDNAATWRWSISIAHEREVAIAIALAQAPDEVKGTGQ